MGSRPELLLPLLEGIGCRRACPVHTPAGLYARAVARGDLDEAFRLAALRNPFVRTCAFICTHPCEDACARSAVDEPLALRRLKRVAVEGGTPPPTPPRLDRGEGRRVAIVGAGPAGLTAAYDLALLGYAVTAFEAHAEPGGMPRHAIPRFRLPTEALEADVRAMLDAGFELRCSTPVDSVDDLLADGFERVAVATGLPRGRPLDVPGHDLPGVHDGLDVLRAGVAGDDLGLGHDVAVIGGGDTAVDAARALVRTGRDVTLLVRRLSLEGRARQQEARAARDEGVRQVTGVVPVSIDGDDRVTAVIHSRVATYHDPRGSYRPRVRPASRTRLAVDSVVVAIGRTPGLEAPPGGIAGGDLTGAGTVIAAVAHGHSMASHIDRDLAGGAVHVPGPGPGFERGPSHPNPPHSPRLNEPSAEGRRCLDCWTQVGPRAHADACLACGRCVNGCPVSALRLLDGLHWDGSRCLRCGLCIERCPAECLSAHQLGEEPHRG